MEVAMEAKGPAPSPSLLAWSRANSVAFIPFAPLGHGYLTGTLHAGAFEESDFRATSPRFSAEAFTRNRAIAEGISRVARAHDATSAQVALAWLLDLSDNTIPIPGTRSGAHLAENLAAGDLRLTPAERRHLDSLPSPHGARY